ncbi:MAG: carboxymuconolactone decarboxylase family protein [Methylobacterium frigidaeris]
MPRINPYESAPGAMQAMMTLAAVVRESGLEPGLQELVKIRVSQINACAYCLDMHVREALKAGETVRRIGLLPAWEESGLFSPREKAALAWAESLTHLPRTGAPDAAYAALAAQFEAGEQVQLTLLVNVVNAWNRFAVGFRYAVPPARDAAA